MMVTRISDLVLPDDLFIKVSRDRQTGITEIESLDPKSGNFWLWLDEKISSEPLTWEEFVEWCSLMKIDSHPGSYPAALILTGISISTPHGTVRWVPIKKDENLSSNSSSFLQIIIRQISNFAPKHFTSRKKRLKLKKNVVG